MSASPAITSIMNELGVAYPMTTTPSVVQLNGLGTQMRSEYCSSKVNTFARTIKQDMGIYVECKTCRPSYEFRPCFVDIEYYAIERVQRRATRLASNSRGVPYHERLFRLRLPTLQHRRRRGDLIEAYKIQHNLYDIEKEKIWTLRQDRRRGHSFSIFKQRARLQRTGSFFTHRVVNDWNRLPEEPVTAVTNLTGCEA